MSHTSTLSLDASHDSPLTPHLSPVTPPGEEGEPVEGYLPVCGLAIAGAILGCLSLLAYWRVFFCSVALAGVVVNGLALWRIAASGRAMSGRRAAIVGLACSLLFGSTAAAHTLLKPLRLHGEARRFALEWFTAFEEGEFEKAFELIDPHWVRLPIDENLAERYEQDPDRKARLENFLNQEPARTLRSLAGKSRVHYVRNEGLRLALDDYDEFNVVDVYEVSVDGSLDSRLLKIELRKLPNLFTKEWGWQVKKVNWLASPPSGKPKTPAS